MRNGWRSPIPPGKVGLFMIAMAALPAVIRSAKPLASKLADNLIKWGEKLKESSKTEPSPTETKVETVAVTPEEPPAKKAEVKAAPGAETKSEPRPEPEPEPKAKRKVKQSTVAPKVPANKKQPKPKKAEAPSTPRRRVVLGDEDTA